MSGEAASDDHLARDEPLDAGRLAPWSVAMGRALRGEADSDVPCGGCTACCRSFQFVHIDPDEIDAIAHIPAELLFPAPQRPRGHLVMGYDDEGRCPMLGKSGCTIYEHRPRTCRMYDCRVFAATGVEPDGDERAAIREQVRRWRFTVTTETDVATRDALHAATGFLRAHPEARPDGAGPIGATALAVLAVDALPAFFAHDEESGNARVVVPDVASVRAELDR
jgi:Fe-S-cluster containining protein